MSTISDLAANIIKYVRGDDNDTKVAMTDAATQTNVEEVESGAASGGDTLASPSPSEDGNTTTVSIILDADADGLQETIWVMQEFMRQEEEPWATWKSLNADHKSRKMTLSALKAYFSKAEMTNDEIRSFGKSMIQKKWRFLEPGYSIPFQSTKRRHKARLVRFDMPDGLEMGSMSSW